MNLINIGDNVLINPDKIDAIELITTKKGKEIIIYVNGTRFTATKNIDNFLKYINQPDLTKQFFAG